MNRPEEGLEGVDSLDGLEGVEGLAGPAGHVSPSRLDCSNALLRMFEYLDGEMSGADCQQIQAHLDECAECLRQYHLDQMVKIVVKRSCGSETAPVTLRHTILQRLTVVRLDATDEVG